MHLFITFWTKTATIQNRLHWSKAVIPNTSTLVHKKKRNRRICLQNTPAPPLVSVRWAGDPRKATSPTFLSVLYQLRSLAQLVMKQTCKSLCVHDIGASFLHEKGLTHVPENFNSCSINTVQLEENKSHVPWNLLLCNLSLLPAQHHTALRSFCFATCFTGLRKDQTGESSL